jgi:hypothetical protein
MIEKNDVQDMYFLTPMQEGMLFHYLMDKKSSAYFEQTAYRIHGELSLKLLERTFIQIIQRFDVLRTIFVHENLQRPMQVVLKERKASVFYEDISHLNEEEKERRVVEFKTNDKKRGFDLLKDNLIRLSILKLADNCYEFVWSFHHILMDGWCIGILVSDFSEIYKTERLDYHQRHLTEGIYNGWANRIGTPRNAIGRTTWILMKRWQLYLNVTCIKMEKPGIKKREFDSSSTGSNQTVLLWRQQEIMSP